MNPAESFSHRQIPDFRTVEHLGFLQDNFYKDRPIMEAHNNNLEQLTDLLIQEISELNGHASDNMSLEKYREQEISDIVWFALGLCRLFGTLPTDEYLQHACKIYDVQMVQDSWAHPQPFSAEDEEEYLSIKSQILSQAQALRAVVKADLSEMSKPDQTRATQRLNAIVGLCWVLFSRLKVNPYDAVREKMARNHAKHLAALYNYEKYSDDNAVGVQGETGIYDTVAYTLRGGKVVSARVSYKDARSEASRLMSQRKGNEEFYADLR